MPLPTNLGRLTFGGIMAQTEEWSCTLNFGGVTDWTPDVTAMKNALLQFAGEMSNLTNINYYKFNEINMATGRFLDQSNSLTEAVSPPVNGVMTAWPAQLALVTTLGTAAQRGRAHSGRIYVPIGSLAIAADGRISAADAVAHGGVIRDAIVAVEAVVGAPLIVWSQVGQTFRPVTRILVGRVIDTQRRRRKSLIEAAGEFSFP